MLRRRIERSKFLTDRRFRGAVTQGFVPSVVFTALGEPKVSLSHFDQGSAAMRLNSRDRSMHDIAGVSSRKGNVPEEFIFHV